MATRRPTIVVRRAEEHEEYAEDQGYAAQGNEDRAKIIFFVIGVRFFVSFVLNAVTLQGNRSCE